MGLAVVGGGVVGSIDLADRMAFRQWVLVLTKGCMIWQAALAPEAVGFSPQLRDDIHRVLSKANDAFEDCAVSDWANNPKNSHHLMLVQDLAVVSFLPPLCRILTMLLETTSKESEIVLFPARRTASRGNKTSTIKHVHMGRTSSVNVGIKCLRVHPFQEPWLVDKATLQYPEHIPTLVLDVDKAQLLANGTRSLPTYAAASNGTPLAGDFAFTTWQQKGAAWKEQTLLDLLNQCGS